MGSFGRPTSLIVRPNWRYLSSIGYRIRPEAFTAEDLAAIRSFGDLVVGTSLLAELKFTVRRGAHKRPTRILAVSADFLRMEGLILAEGRLFNDEDDRSLRRIGILGAVLAQKLFPGEDPLGRSIAVGSFGEIEVVGVLKEEPASFIEAIENYDSTNNGTLFIPNSTAGRFGAARFNYELRVEAASPELSAKTEALVLSVLAELHGLWEDQPKFIVRSGKNAFDQMNDMTGLVAGFISAVAGISLVVAGIGVMNVMLISVKERTREIGTRKALGARKSWIRRQFLIESILVCAAGGIGGVFLAAAAAQGMAALAGWPPLMAPGSIPAAIVLSLAVALAFGWLPAVRASRLQPSEALRYE
jgi:putative ABC transport system permease protein